MESRKFPISEQYGQAMIAHLGDIDLSPEDLQGLIESFADRSDDANGISYAVLAAARLAMVPIVITDPNKPDNPIVFTNEAFTKLTGYRFDEVAGKNCRLLQGPGTDRRTVDHISRELRNGNIVQTEILNYRKDGSEFWNSVYIRAIAAPDGRIAYYFASQIDVTRRFSAEAAVDHSQKMAAIGQLTSGIAHDFNNLLTIVGGFNQLVALELAKGNSPDPARLGRFTQSIASALERASSLTQHLLAFSRSQSLELRVVNLERVVVDMLPLLEKALDGRHRIRLATVDDGAVTRTDISRLELALMNLVINARDAMPEGGTIDIDILNRSVPNYARQQGDITPGRYAVVRVRDNGHGIEQSILSRVTDPFFTTKPAGKGTGLGLAIISRFMRETGGSLHIVSTPDKGTDVSLFFPLTDEPAGVVLDEPQEGALRLDGGGRAILIAESSREVTSCVSEILETAGYAPVDLAERSDVERWDAVGGSIAGAIINIDGNGLNLAESIAQTWRSTERDIPILVTKGGAVTSAELDVINRYQFRLLKKPYDAKSLIGLMSKNPKL